MEKEYTYSAFISYSSKDKKAAKALWKKLERYRLPAVLQKQYEEVPEKMHVFLDQGDIAPGGTVEKALCRELADSKKLIVICSPNSAVSPYVELEVQNFLALGHTMDDIIPYIIAGEVKKGSANNCYVPSLFGESGKDNANGVSVLRDGKLRAFSGVLSNILGVKFDEVYQREKRRRNQLIAAYSALSTVAACFLAALVWYVMPHTRYYADYVTRWGVPEGVGKELSKKEIKSRYAHYEITSQYGKVIQLVYANSAQVPLLANDAHLQERQNRPTVAQYKYANMYLPQRKKNQELTEALYTVSTGTSYDFIRTYQFMLIYSGRTEDSINIDFYYNNEERLQKSISNNIFSEQGMYYADIRSLSVSDEIDNLHKKEATKFFIEDVSPIYRHKVLYDKDGYEKQIDFYNKNNRLVSDKNGIKGIVFEYDDDKRIIKERYLYENYQPSSVISKKMTYDTAGNLIEITYHGADEPKLKDNRERAFAKKGIEWDENHKNPIAYHFFDENGIPSSQNFLFDCVEFSVKYDEHAFEKSGEILDAAGNKTGIFIKSNENGFPVEFVTVQNGEEIDHAIMEYMISEMNPSTKNVFGVKSKRNSVFQISKEITLDKNGDETWHIEYSYQYEDGEQKITKKFVSDEGTGCHVDTFDKFNRYVESRHVSEDGSLGVISRIDYKGDNRSICHYFADGTYYDAGRVKKTTDSEIPDKGYARADFAYNNDGRLVYVAFKDRWGNLSNCTLDKLHFSTYRATYSPNGHLIKAEYKMANGELAAKDAVKSDYAPYYSAKTDIDDMFVLSSIRLHDKNGKLSLIESKDYEKAADGDIVVSERRSDGRINAQEIYRDKKLLKTKMYAYKENADYTVYTFDTYGRTLSSEYYGSDGVLKNRPNQKYSVRKDIYLENGEVRHDFIDAEGKLVSQMYKNKQGKTTKYVNYKNYSTDEYDEQGRVFVHNQFDSEGKLTEGSKFSYNCDGPNVWNVTTYTETGLELNASYYFQEVGKYVNNEEGWAIKSEKIIDGQKWTLYLNEQIKLIFSKSAYIIEITDVPPDSFSDKNGIKAGDILLVLGNFDYFANGTREDLDSNQQNEEKRCVVYNPETKKITELYGASFDFGFQQKPAAETNESALQYIAQIKSTYDGWLKTK